MTKRKPKPVSLRDHVIEILDANRGNWPHIAAETGLTYVWLQKLAQGKIPNPGILGLEKVVNWYEGG